MTKSAQHDIESNSELVRKQVDGLVQEGVASMV